MSNFQGLFIKKKIHVQLEKKSKKKHLPFYPLYPYKSVCERDEEGRGRKSREASRRANDTRGQSDSRGREGSRCRKLHRAERGWAATSASKLGVPFPRAITDTGTQRTVARAIVSERKGSLEEQSRRGLHQPLRRGVDWKRSSERANEMRERERERARERCAILALLHQEYYVLCSLFPNLRQRRGQPKQCQRASQRRYKPKVELHILHIEKPSTDFRKINNPPGCSVVPARIQRRERCKGWRTYEAERERERAKDHVFPFFFKLEQLHRNEFIEHGLLSC